MKCWLKEVFAEFITLFLMMRDFRRIWHRRSIGGTFGYSAMVARRHFTPRQQRQFGALMPSSRGSGADPLTIWVGSRFIPWTPTRFIRPTMEGQTYSSWIPLSLPGSGPDSQNGSRLTHREHEEAKKTLHPTAGNAPVWIRASISAVHDPDVSQTQNHGSEEAVSVFGGASVPTGGATGPGPRRAGDARRGVIGRGDGGGWKFNAHPAAGVAGCRA